MIIAIVHEPKAYLPEVENYCRFFERYQVECIVVNKDDLGLQHRHVEWRLMGTDLTKPKEGILKIHEYCSASVPPWRKLKNWSRSFFNTQPDFRLFLNEYVKNSFGFHDRIPAGFHNKAVPGDWMQTVGDPSKKQFDFVITGTCAPIHEPEKLLSCFSTGALAGKTLLVVGNRNPILEQLYHSFSNITFTGPVPHADIPGYLKQARFGINYVANKEPFSRQASVKLLEYAATGMPVITTRYAWVENFQKKYGGNYFSLDEDLGNFNWEQVNNFSYAQPNLDEWTWEKQLRKSGVLEFLQSRYPELQF